MNKKLCCYKCESTTQLLVEEKIDNDTGKIIEKNFICVECAGGRDKLFKTFGEIINDL